tara:strand:+ start:261 stop:530 length:270 start_codon:yes stop_codon:yes gene_type:complete
MADFFIIQYRSKHHEDKTKYRDCHPAEHIAVDVDSVVTIEKSGFGGVDTHIVHVDTGFTYHGTILKKVTEEEVVPEINKLPSNLSPQTT